MAKKAIVKKASKRVELDDVVKPSAKQTVLAVDHAALFASSALNALIAKAEEKDSYEDICDAAWQMGNMMVARRSQTPKVEDKQLPLPLAPAVP
jgi:hypothetical protein